MNCLNVDPALPLTSCWTLDISHGSVNLSVLFSCFLTSKMEIAPTSWGCAGFPCIKSELLQPVSGSLFRCYFLNYGGSMFGAGAGKGKCIPQCQCKCTWVSEKTSSKEQGVCISGTEATCGRTGAGEIRVVGL